ncbi:MAG TPA: ATP-binding protein [Gemmatimonadales bacterium]|jgi:signal transduction histidine kinase
MKVPVGLPAIANRTTLLVLAALLVVALAVTDWLTKPYISIGFLYLFPIMIAGAFLSRGQTVAVALVCAVLQEAFSNLPENEAIARLIFSSTGFVATGLLVAELVRNRRIALAHVVELEGEVRLRRDAEEQIRILVDSSPAAIVVVDAAGRILLANDAAETVLAPSGAPLPGQSIHAYLPALQGAMGAHPSRFLRTAMQCRGERGNHEAFLAGVWFSTYETIAGPRLAAIIVDLSEDLRSREDLSFDRLLRHARIVMSALGHEIRNLASAVQVVQKNLSRLTELEQNEDFRALGTLVRSLENIAALELRPSPPPGHDAVDLTPVLDEVRVLLDAAYRESGIEVQWRIPESLSLVRADPYGLVQVFLNLAKNSQRAMQDTPIKRLTVSAAVERGSVVIRVVDTGVGVAAPEDLFRPFQRDAAAAGLGLYVSRAVMRSFGGELIYEPTPEGCCFAVVLPLVAGVEEAVSA